MNHQTIDGITYTDHALARMASRGIPASVVAVAVRRPDTEVIGRRAGEAHPVRLRSTVAAPEGGTHTNHSTRGREWSGRHRGRCFNMLTFGSLFTGEPRR